MTGTPKDPESVARRLEYDAAMSGEMEVNQQLAQRKKLAGNRHQRRLADRRERKRGRQAAFDEMTAGALMELEHMVGGKPA